MKMGIKYSVRASVFEAMHLKAFRHCSYNVSYD